MQDSIYGNFRGNVRNHIKKCWQAVQNDQEMPDEPVEVVKFNKSVAFMEAITESISQLCISCIILRIYGVSTFTFTKFFQFFSLITSLLSLCVAFGTVSIFFLQKVKKTIEKKKPIWFFFFSEANLSTTNGNKTFRSLSQRHIFLGFLQSRLQYLLFVCVFTYCLLCNLFGLGCHQKGVINGIVNNHGGSYPSNSNIGIGNFDQINWNIGFQEM